MKKLLPGATSFYEHEFACKHCGMTRFHPGFVEELQALRDEVHKATGRGMTVNSGCRCTVHNRNVGGASKSLHICDEPQHPGQLGTLGVDIATPDGIYRGHLFAIAWRHGWSVGWNKPSQFLHLDRRDWVGLPQRSFDY